jgi:hypothetical protein
MLKTERGEREKDIEDRTVINGTAGRLIPR